MRRAGPRPIAAALDRVVRGVQPATGLARVQAAWDAAAGERVAREAAPVAERGGVVTIACSSAVWAQELELLAGELRTRLDAALGGDASAPAVRSLRFVVRA